MDPLRRRGQSLSIATVLAVLAGSFGAMLWSAPSAAAVTYVQGAITVDTTWGITDNEYVLTGHVTVRAGVTLMIEQGTTVRMDPGRALFVEGRLIAQGFPGNEVAFRENNTAAIFPPQGIQFNASSTGSVDRATFDRFERPVSAVDSSPWIGSNYVGSAFYAFYLVRSNSWVWGNAIERATIGIFATESNAQIVQNSVNGTATGIQAANGGTPLITDNVVTNATGFVAVGIRVTSGTAGDILRNTVYGIQGIRGGNGMSAGASGGGGGIAVGILVDNAPSAVVQENVVSAIYGGRGGDGAPNATGVGGRGGDGGAAAGIIVGAVASVDVGNNIVTNVVSGRGGSGGGALGTVTGGTGGDAGDAAAIEILGTTGSGFWYSNWIDAITGGSGGSGGDGAGPDGAGGIGGDAFGIFTLDAMNGEASGNSVYNTRAGTGGNSTTGAGNGNGGTGGAATGIAVNGAAGSSLVHSNVVGTVVGGDGGRGGAGGGGGNATGAYLLGKGDGNYNATSATSNWIQDIFGGGGAVGARAGGAGGTAQGITVATVSPFNGGNTVWNLQGGDGGDSLDGTDGGRGGDAAGHTAYIVPSGWSAGDGVIFVAAGDAGAGPPTLASYSVGFYMEGVSGTATAFTIENASIAFVGTFDIWSGNFADGTTINTPFDPSKVGVEATATLTVKNFLAVDVYWPDGFTLVSGADVVVEEDGTPVWSMTAPAGQVAWLLTTDRVYEFSANTPKDVQNDVTVSYLAYNFANNPRTVDMAWSNGQTFFMLDEEAPTSIADALPTYTTVSTFPVTYTASDGFGAGLQDITLWYRKDGAGWTPDATQPAGPTGSFTFTTIGDGTYEFATIASDWAGNSEPGPSANETWTIVDTVRPASAVATLPTYTTTATFTVTWAPDPGVTDIARYTVQYNNGAGWTNWLVDVTFTNAMFTASPPAGAYAFRSIATDWAGNVEVLPATNDTWTIVDTQLPASAVSPLASYQTTLTFTVSWAPQGGTTDIASYRIEVNDDGAGWTVWLPSTTSTSAPFTGVDGHAYEFRSIATDWAGNVEPAPAGADASTIVDTSLPGSTVAPLPTWTTTASFTVSWAPDPGVTDIARYTVQFNRGFGWTSWLVDVTITSAVFTATQPWGVHEFRSIATDVAGNVEPAPATNDTWTHIDTEPPASTVDALAPYQTTLAFTVSWRFLFDSFDVASYRIDAKDDTGPWVTWIPSTTATSSGFTGVDGHVYAFRSVATDWAGNVEALPSGNDTWTIVDVTAPLSAMAALPAYTTSVVASLSWGASGGTTDIASYTVQVRDNGGAWADAPGLVDTPAVGGTYTGQDGHRYEFRSLATDVAGNVEVAPATNDTWTIVDITPPATTFLLSGTQGLNNWYTSGVTFTLTATDATSGVSEIHYVVDGTPYQIYSGPFVVSGDGDHTVTFHAHDNAGLQELDASVGFDIDATPPATTANLVGQMGDNGWHRSAVTVTLSPADATSGLASTSYRLDAGAWQTYAGPVSVTTDGAHTVEYYSTDQAGLQETMGSVTFQIDSTAPLVTTTEPRGTGTNTTPLVVITFSEGMNRASVESAFTINPDMNGAFTWSADNRTLTFRPDRTLQPGTDYFVAIGTNAKDLAGNPLPQTVTFSFQTAALPSTPGGGVMEYLWIIAVIAAGLGGSLFIVMRRLGARSKPEPVPTPAKEGGATIEDVFLLYRDGILIKHETRRLKPDIDTDILSGMLTAVQSFVKDSFRSEEGELDELTFGEMHILIGRGKWIILAAMVQGDGTVSMRAQIEKCIQDMEAQHPEEIEKWDGNMTIARTLSPYIKKLIRGEYV